MDLKKTFMYSKIILILFFLVNQSVSCYSQKENRYTTNEAKYLNIFQNFINYFRSGIQNKTEITDSTHLKFILSNYLFVDKKPGAELNGGQLNTLRAELE